MELVVESVPKQNNNFTAENYASEMNYLSSVETVLGHRANGEITFQCNPPNFLRTVSPWLSSHILLLELPLPPSLFYATETESRD